jgi:hypothetical protein
MSGTLGHNLCILKISTKEQVSATRAVFHEHLLVLARPPFNLLAIYSFFIAETEG